MVETARKGGSAEIEEGQANANLRGETSALLPLNTASTLTRNTVPIQHFFLIICLNPA